MTLSEIRVLLIMYVDGLLNENGKHKAEGVLINRAGAGTWELVSDLVCIKKYLSGLYTVGQYLNRFSVTTFSGIHEHANEIRKSREQ